MSDGPELGGSFAALSALASEGVEFIVDLAHALPESVEGDADALRRAVTALLTRAAGELDAGWLHLYVTHDAAADELVIGVEDSGDERSLPQAHAYRAAVTAALGDSAGVARLDVESLAFGGHRTEISIPWPPSADGMTDSHPNDQATTPPLDVMVICDRPRTAAVLVQRLAEAGMRASVLNDVVSATRAIGARERLDAVIAMPSVGGVPIEELLACWTHARPELAVLLAPLRPDAISQPAAGRDTTTADTLPYPWTAHELARCLGGGLEPSTHDPRPALPNSEMAPAA